MVGRRRAPTGQNCSARDRKKRHREIFEAAHWVQVLKERCQCGREGREHDNGSYIFHKKSKF